MGSRREFLAAGAAGFLTARRAEVFDRYRLGERLHPQLHARIADLGA